MIDKILLKFNYFVKRNKAPPAPLKTVDIPFFCEYLIFGSYGRESSGGFKEAGATYV
jgi:hypothetical protein